MVFLNRLGFQQMECGIWRRGQNNTLSGTFWRAPPERYVALSRVRDCKNIAMYLTDEQLIVSDESGHIVPTVNNIVYQDVLALNS